MSGFSISVKCSRARHVMSTNSQSQAIDTVILFVNVVAHVMAVRRECEKSWYSVTW